MTQPRFSAAEIINAKPCVHSVKRSECPSCIRHRLWYKGRIDGLLEAATLLSKNAAMVDAMREAVMDAERNYPSAFFNNRLIDRAEKSP